VVAHRRSGVAGCGERVSLLLGDSRIVHSKMRQHPLDYSEYPGRTEAFFPNYLLKEWMVGAVVLIGFLILTIAHDPPLQVIADPTDTGYQPVPDWYFLFLFEVLKYTYASGPYTALGAVVIPGLAFTALMLAPWLDTGPERRWYKRPIASGLMFATLFSLFFLTYAAASDHNWDQEELYAADSEAQQVEIDTTAEGYEIYADQSCISCHGENLEGTGAGPALFDVGEKFGVDEIQDIIDNGIGSMPAGQFDGAQEDQDAMAEWLSVLGTDEEPEAGGDAGADDEDAGDDDGTADEEDDAA
jgi:menaquinol-cytochrome c reductase cytochrome b/c subunit